MPKGGAGRTVFASARVHVHEDSETSDLLTGALPRAAFNACLERVVGEAEARGEPVSLIVLDIDHFKSVNDAFGHSRGDEVLAEFSGRLAEAIRAGDLVFRFGGDEFVLLLPGIGRAEASAVARRILARVRSQPFAGDPPVTGSLSIGVAALPEDSRTAQGLFQAADLRLLEAKRGGRGRVVASDRGGAAPGPATLSRLIDRDREVEALHRFMRDLPHTGRAAIVLRGEHGSGRARLLEELRRIADLYAFRVAAVHAREPLRTRSFGAILESVGEFGGVVPIPGSDIDVELADLLRATGRRGLLLLVDRLGCLDEDSLAALQRIVQSDALDVVGLACTLDSGQSVENYIPAVPSAETIELPGISRDGLRSLVRTVARREPSEPALDWIAAASRGLPGRAVRAVQVLGATPLPPLDAWTRAAAPPDGWLEAELERRDATGPAVLPEFAHPLIGRDREVEQARRLLRDSRLLAITGTAGVGKTRLAVQVAREAAMSFPGGRWMVRLDAEATDPVAATAAVLGVDSPLGPDAALRDFLHDRICLVILDGLIAGPRSIALLDLLLASSAVRCIVTCESLLGLPSHPALELRGLAVPQNPASRHLAGFPAVRLLLQQAKRAGVEVRLDAAGREAVTRICSALDGQPQTLEIAGALLGVLPVSELLARVEKGLDLRAAAAVLQGGGTGAIREIVSAAPDASAAAGRRSPPAAIQVRPH